MPEKQPLLIPLLQAFCWFDEGLQAYLRDCGWDDVSRPESMIMANVVMGITRPSDIARRVGVSRQAVHTTLGRMIDKGILALEDDPQSGRGKIVSIARKGQAMRRDAQAAMDRLTAILRERIGPRQVDALSAALSAPWGDPPDEFGGAKPRRRRPALSI